MSPRKAGARLQSTVAGTTVFGLALPTHFDALLARALPPEVCFKSASDFAEVERLASSESAPVLVYALPASTPFGSTNATCLKQTLRVHEALRACSGTLPAAALCTSNVIDTQLVLSLRAVPHVQLVSLDTPSPQRALWRALEELLGAAVTTALARAIGVMPPLLHVTMRQALSGVGLGMQVPHLAHACMVPERTLRRRLDDETPRMTPQAVLGWARILLAAWHMRDGTRPLVDIANALGFSAASNLHRSIKEYTGLSVQTLRAGDPVAAVVARFRATISVSSARYNGVTADNLEQPHAPHLVGAHHDGHQHPRHPHRQPHLRGGVPALHHQGGEEGTHAGRVA